MDHAPATGLLAALIAGTIAVRSIRSNRDVARLRETYNSLSSANWDADYIRARKVFSALKKRHEGNPQNVSCYCYPLPEKNLNDLNKEDVENATKMRDKEIDEHEDNAAILRTILNNYENQSLGIKLGILDEPFMFRYLRSSVIDDWKALSPLVAAYRGRYSNSLLYIEFEGLSHAWENHRSFQTGKKMRPAKKRTSFR